MTQDPMLGRVIDGKFHVQRKLGQGGFGAVYQARHSVWNRDVAIKLLHPGLSQDPDAQRRFFNEVGNVAKVTHPYAVPLREFGKDPELNMLYFTMDLVVGQTLRDVLRSSGGKLAPERITKLILQVLGVLAQAHKLGLIHRDLKPENLMVMRDERGEEEVRVLDFGIAKAISQAQGEQQSKSRGIVGTLFYMSPEQLRGERLDARSDMWSIGVILYEALSGKLPIAPSEQAEDSQQSFMFRMMTQPPTPLQAVAPHVPEPLARVVMSALAKEVAKRIPSALAFKAALEAGEANSRAGMSLGGGATGVIPDAYAGDEKPAAGRGRLYDTFSASKTGMMPKRKSSGHFPQPAAQPEFLEDLAGLDDLKADLAKPRNLAILAEILGRVLVVGDMSPELREEDANPGQLAGELLTALRAGEPMILGDGTHLSPAMVLGLQRGIKADLASLSDKLASHDTPSQDAIQAALNDRPLLAQRVMTIGARVGARKPGPDCMTEGDTVDNKYSLLKFLGKGPASETWAGRREGGGNQPVRAIKILRGASGGADWAREVRFWAHELLVQTLETQADSQPPYMVTEHVAGASLRDVLLERAPLDLDGAVHILNQLCQALAHIHNMGFLHGNLKPENVILTSPAYTPDARIKLTDYGHGVPIGVPIEEEPGFPLPFMPTAILSGGRPLDDTITYVDPALFQGLPAEPRTDIYALGVIASELLTGRPPTVGTLESLEEQHHLEPLKDLLRRSCGRWDQRFASIEEFLACLREISEVRGGVPAFDSVAREICEEMIKLQRKEKRTEERVTQGWFGTKTVPIEVEVKVALKYEDIVQITKERINDQFEGRGLSHRLAVAAVKAVGDFAGLREYPGRAGAVLDAFLLEIGKSGSPFRLDLGHLGALDRMAIGWREYSLELRNARVTELGYQMRGGVLRLVGCDVAAVAQELRGGRVECDSSTRIQDVGADMSYGEVIIQGDVSRDLGRQLAGGRIVVKGNVLGDVGKDMRNGEIIVEGTVTGSVGHGLRGGRIEVHGEVYGYASRDQTGGEVCLSQTQVGSEVARNMRGGILRLAPQVTLPQRSEWGYASPGRTVFVGDKQLGPGRAR